MMKKSLHLIAKAGEGSVRDMLSIADSVASFCDYNITSEQTEKVIGLSDRDSIKNILNAIASKDVNALFLAVKSALGRGKNIQVLCKEMADFIKNLVMIKVGVGDYTILDILPGEFVHFSEIANMFNIEYLKSAFSKFAKIELELKYSLNPENLFESACLELVDFGVQPQTQPTQQINISAQPVQMAQQEQVKTQVQPIAQNLQPVEEKREQTEIERVWGNVLLKVKENNMFALSNALINVNKVQQIAKKLIISTNDLGSYEMIDNKDRIAVLLKIVNLFDDSISEVIVEYDKQNASVQDIKDSLKDAFKNKIKFKE